MPPLRFSLLASIVGASRLSERLSLTPLPSLHVPPLSLLSVSLPTLSLHFLHITLSRALSLFLQALHLRLDSAAFCLLPSPLTHRWLTTVSICRFPFIPFLTLFIHIPCKSDLVSHSFLQAVYLCFQAFSENDHYCCCCCWCSKWACPSSSSLRLS